MTQGLCAVIGIVLIVSALPVYLVQLVGRKVSAFERIAAALEKRNG